MKFALLSHVLPPAPSGQSVMLFRILSGLAAEEYYLISREKYERQNNAKDFLSAPYYALRPLKYLYLLNRYTFSFIRDVLTISLSIFARAREIVTIMHQHPVDVLVACSGDIADIPAGFIASAMLGIPFVGYLFDDYVYQWTGIQRWLARVMASFIFRHCAGAIGPNEFICSEYQRRYGVQCALVRNPGDQAELGKPVHLRWPSEDGKITIAYTGAIYHANYDCFRNLVRVLETLQDPHVELHIFTSQTREQLIGQGIQGERVYIHTHVPYAEILEYQRRADILFLPLAFETPINEVIRTSAPGKLAEYLASGRPVLAHVPADSFVAYYLEKNRCGLVANRNEPDHLKGNILRLINDEDFRSEITRNASQRARLDFDPQVARERFVDFLSARLGHLGSRSRSESQLPEKRIN